MVTINIFTICTTEDSSKETGGRKREPASLGGHRVPNARVDKGHKRYINYDDEVESLLQNECI